MNSISELLKKVEDVQYNPHAIQRIITKSLRDMSDGKYELFEPSNPFVFAIETAVALSAAGIQRNETLIRKQYPELAQTYDDLYPHMSDVDYLNRFATPNEAEIVILLSYDELLSKSILDTDGLRKTIIPKDTTFTVDGIDFSLVYPVVIKIQPHGSLQIVYDVSEANPFYTLDTNLVDWRLVNMPDQTKELSHLNMVFMRVKVLQLKTKSHYDQLNSFTGFSKSYGYLEQYYHTRVYMLENDRSEWVEIKTTHSDQVYDTRVVTAKLKVDDGVLNVTIPSVYFTRNMVHPNIRIDIYTTKGKMNIGLDRFTPSSYVATWDDKRKQVDPFTTVIADIDTLLIYSESTLNQGSNGLTFEQVRKRVIEGSLGKIDIPITPAQLSNTLNDINFNIIKDIDNTTKRLYVATRGLEPPTNGSVSTPVGCTIQQLNSTVKQLSGLSTVKENYKRLTIESGTLFELQKGVLSIVSNSEKAALLDNSLDYLINEASNKQYLYNPVHYVIDYVDELRLRSYFLDEPAIKSKEFVSDNPTTGLEIMTMRYGISKTDIGYKIIVVTKSSDKTKELVGDRIKLQLRYKPVNDQLYAYVDVPFISLSQTGDLIFEATLASKFDIDSNDLIVFNNFSVTDTDSVNTYCSLNVRMDLIYIIEDYTHEGIKNTELDRVKHTPFLSEDSYVISQETITVHLGYRLKDLWDRARTVVSKNEYLTYEQDIPHLHEVDVYKRNKLTGSYELDYNEATGLVTSTKIASKGDPVLVNGEPRILHKKGSVKMDSSNKPIVKQNRDIAVSVDLMLFEGAYFFASERTAVNAKNETIRTLVQWIIKEMPKLNGRLLENTRMQFKPKQNIGWIDVIVNNGNMTSMSSAQSLRVKIYMTTTAYNNLSLRSDLEKMAKEVIVKELSKDTVSSTNMGYNIKKNAVDGVIDVSVSGLGGVADFDLVSASDASVTLSLAKKLDIMSDQSITVRDDILFEYIEHTKRI